MFRRKGIVVFFTIILATGIFLANYLRQHYCVPILMYHSVALNPDSRNRLAVSAGTFERQMRFLKKHKFNVVPLEELVGLIKTKKIPPRTVALTFDDGYRDTYTYAYPALKKYNLPATFFIITNEVGRQQNDRLNWEEILEMQNSGLVTIGSHCLGPEPLVNLKTEDEQRREISTSKKVLEEKLGREVALFSYPEGLFNAKIRQLVIEAGYKLAVATNPGKSYPSDDIFALKRLRISENASNLFVFFVEASGYYTAMKEAKRKHGKK